MKICAHERRERRSFQDDAFGCRANRRVIAANDAGNADRLLFVGDHNVFRAQRIFFAVQCQNRFALARRADNNGIAQQISVIGVHGLAKLTQNVVRYVHQVVDGINAERVEPVLHPQR